MAEQAGCLRECEVDRTPEEILSRDEWFTSNPTVSSYSACPQDVSFFIEKTCFFILRGAFVTVDYRYAGNVCLDPLFSNGRIED